MAPCSRPRSCKSCTAWRSSCSLFAACMVHTQFCVTHVDQLLRPTVERMSTTQQRVSARLGSRTDSDGGGQGGERRCPSFVACYLAWCFCSDRRAELLLPRRALRHLNICGEGCTCGNKRTRFGHKVASGSVVQASSLHATSPQRAPTRAQLKAGLPSRALTLLCVRHNHCDSSAREATVGGSALHVLQ